jgi:Protein of unknown function (DUF1458).
VITRSQPPRPLRQRAVETAGESVRESGIAEVIRQDVTIQDGKVSEFPPRNLVQVRQESAGDRLSADRFGQIAVSHQGGSTPPVA